MELDKDLSGKLKKKPNKKSNKLKENKGLMKLVALGDQDPQYKY